MNTIKNIFLTDDDHDDCMLFSESLSDLYDGNQPKLVVAHDGVELFNVMDRYIPPPPEVIFLDINMPRKNGLDCLKEIRSMPKYKDIPIVMLSTTSNQSVIDKTYELGANYYMAKPDSYAKMKLCLLQIFSFGAEKLREFPVRNEFVIKA